MALPENFLNNYIAGLNDPNQPHAMASATLWRCGYRIMHYYGDRILATVDEITEFCKLGMRECEGSELERLVNIYCDLNDGRFHLYDRYHDGHEDDYDNGSPIRSYAQWQSDYDALLA